MADGSQNTPIPKVITGPVPEDYAELPEEERMEIASQLAADIRSGLGRLWS